MDMPIRKNPRLKGYDYGTPGAYFITICVQNKRCILSEVVGLPSAPAETKLTAYGEIARNELLRLEERYPFLSVDCFTIMPNHVHMILTLSDSNADMLPASIIDVVRVYKSLTTVKCRKLGFEGKLFQTSFYDHVIRNRDDYEEIFEYITGNPVKWQGDRFYSKILTEKTAQKKVP